MIRRPALIAMLAAGWLTCCGCGDIRPRTAPVTGQVTVQGRQLTSGTVTLVPIQPGPPATGTIDAAGRFTLTTFVPGDGAIPGQYAVMVVAVALPDGRLPDDVNSAVNLLVPRKYASHRTSGLTVEVEPGAINTVEIKLD